MTDSDRPHRRRAWLRFICTAPAIAALLALVASASAPGQEQPPAESPDPTVVDGSAQRELDAHREQWTREDLTTYRFTLRLVCFCPSPARTPVEMLVRNGVPVDPPAYLLDAASVPQLLDI